MKKYTLTFLALLICAYVKGQTTSYTAVNPNNSGASVSLSWLNDVARIRVGGTGVGAGNGFSIQSVGDKILMRFLDNGNIGIGPDEPGTYRLSIKQAGTSSAQGIRILNSIGTKSLQFWVGTGGAVIDAEGTSNLHFRTAGYDRLFIANSGNVGIGFTNPTHKLAVDGVISAKEVRVSNTPNSDYVFEPDYNLLSLHEVETFIKENKHLPNIPSAEEFKENGVGLGEMDNMLLRKVEELMLYVIELKRENEELKAENQIIKNSLLEEIETIKTQLK